MTVTAEALELSTTGFVPCSGPAERYVGDDRGPARCEFPAEWRVWSTCTTGAHKRVPMCADCLRILLSEINRIPRRICVAHQTVNPIPAFKFGEL